MQQEKLAEIRKSEDIKKLQELMKSSGWEEEKKKRELEKERAKILADLKEAEKWLEEKRKRSKLTTGGKKSRKRYTKTTRSYSKKHKSRKSSYIQLKKRH
jgi:hypothetical protein